MCSCCGWSKRHRPGVLQSTASEESKGAQRGMSPVQGSHAREPAVELLWNLSGKASHAAPQCMSQKLRSPSWATHADKGTPHIPIVLCCCSSHVNALADISLTIQATLHAHVHHQPFCHAWGCEFFVHTITFAALVITVVFSIGIGTNNLRGIVQKLHPTEQSGDHEVLVL